MTATMTTESASAMSVDEALELVGSATLLQLADMPRDVVAAMPEDARRLRRDRLAADTTLWGIKAIMAAAECGRDAVAKWRRNYLVNGEEGPNALPEPLPSPDIKRPGDQGPRGGSPQWPAGKLRAWLALWGRTDEDFFPTPGGRKPPGRPPGS